MSKYATWVATHRKALVAYAGFVLTVATLAFPDARWLPPVIAAAAALGVHGIRNAPQK